MAKDRIIKEQLTELLDTYYNGSFPQMACEYILCFCKLNSLDYGE